MPKRYTGDDAIPGFAYDPNGRPRSGEVAKLFDEYGFESWKEILTTKGSDNDPEHYRSSMYPKLIQALRDYRNLLGYTKFYYDPDDGFWHVYVERSK